MKKCNKIEFMQYCADNDLLIDVVVEDYMDKCKDKDKVSILEFAKENY